DPDGQGTQLPGHPVRQRVLAGAAGLAAEQDGRGRQDRARRHGAHARHGFAGRSGEHRARVLPDAARERGERERRQRAGRFQGAGAPGCQPAAQDGPVTGSTMARKSQFLSGRRIDPRRITGGMTVPELIDGTFLAYNAGRLREGCRLFTEKMLEDDVTVGVSITGALTPAGLGISALIPLVEAGFIDWVVSTGANLYHDAHFGLGLELHQGNPHVSDLLLREEEVVRIYDIFFDYSVLLDTDAFFREMIRAPEFNRTMSTAEFHHLRDRKRV